MNPILLNISQIFNRCSITQLIRVNKVKYRLRLLRTISSKEILFL
jgi:hypothetical protein